MTLEPISEHLTRALLYVELASRVGVSADELNFFGRTPPPNPPRVVQFDPYYEDFLQEHFSDAVPGDDLVDYMTGTGWIEPALNDRWMISALGKALVGRLAAETRPLDTPSEEAIILAPGDPLRYELLTRALSNAEMLVDPFFKADQLDWLVSTTSIQRVLISEKGAKESLPKGGKTKNLNRALIEMALGRLRSKGQDVPEVRASSSSALHDRAVVYGDKPTALLGTSLTGLSTHLSVITPLPAEASAAYTTRLDSLWDASTPLVPRDKLEPSAPDDSVGSLAESEDS